MWVGEWDRCGWFEAAEEVEEEEMRSGGASRGGDSKRPSIVQMQLESVLRQNQHLCKSLLCKGRVGVKCAGDI